MMSRRTDDSQHLGNHPAFHLHFDHDPLDVVLSLSRRATRKFRTPSVGADPAAASSGRSRRPRRMAPLRSKDDDMQKLTPFLWFDGRAEEAVQFYVSVFKNARAGRVLRYSEAGPGPSGSVMTASFELEGLEFTA